MNTDTITINISDSDDDNLVYIPATGDSLLPSIDLSDYSTITGVGDFTFTTSAPEITLGSTSITEEKLKDLLVVLDMINDLPNNSGIKKLFNAHKAAKKLGLDK